MADKEVVGYNPSTEEFEYIGVGDRGLIGGDLVVGGLVTDARGSIPFQLSATTRAVRVAITGATSGSNGIQALDNANLDMATNGFTPWVRKRISTTRPSANEILEHKHDGTFGWIITLLTTGIIRLTLNGFTYDSTAALPAATNVNPLIKTPIVRETTSAAGSVVFVVDGVQLGSAVAIAVPGNTALELVTNGDFASGITGWTESDPWGVITIAWDGVGAMSIVKTTPPTNTSEVYSAAIAVGLGKTYRIIGTVTYVSGTVTGSLGLRSTNNVGTAANIGTQVNLNTGSSTSFDFYANSDRTGNVYLGLRLSSGACEIKLDNVSVKEVYASVNNAVPLYALGTSTTRTEGDYYEHGLYNRALTVAECLRHAVLGPDAADVGSGSVIPSQTITSSWTWSNFAGAPGYETFTTSGSDITSAINTSGLGIASAAYTSLLGKRYRVKMSLTVNSGTVELKWAATTDLSSGGQQIAVYTSANDGDIEIEFVAQGAYTRLGFYSPGSRNFSVTGFQIQVIGIVGWWNAEDAQSNTGQIFDRSGNKLHAILPAAGATILPVAPRTFQVRSTHIWVETDELQYLMGVTQGMVPATARLVRIFGEISSTGGSGPQDITIGDGSDADRYVVATVGLATGKREFSIDATYAGFNDGTNLKGTIKPDAVCTMVVKLVLIFETLET